MPKLSPEEFAAIIEKHSQIAEYDVVTNLLSTIPVDCDPELVDKMVKENQGIVHNKERAIEKRKKREEEI